jgi:addiction module RelB/DinJ family antitoxin
VQTAVINFNTEEKTKQEAQKVAKKMGVSLSTILNHYLKHFVKTKTVVFSVEDEVPNEYLAHALKESEEDVNAGRLTTFEGTEKTLDYLAAEIENDKKSSR